MKLCIIGTGAAGWMACATFKNDPNIKSVTMIGSPHIPSIGVGESNTIKLITFHNECGIDQNEFIAKSDAAVKYGVYYKNWSKHDFLHNFKTSTSWNALHILPTIYYRILANKPADVPISELVGIRQYEAVHKNLIFLEDTFYPKSWHFDAGKYIEFISDHCLKDPKVSLISDTVLDVEKNDDKMDRIILQSGRILEYDYYIFATGYNDILKEEKVELSDVLLTDKAFVYPLQYTNKREQFHPYTVAKTMKHGWRWITPTWSRIGTGYVFSSRHVSVDEAREEFIKDVGEDIEPKLVNFYPRYNTETYKQNYCTVGLSNGFLEPLDAPGLSLTIDAINHLKMIFLQRGQIYDKKLLDSLRLFANERMISRYKFWAAFILTQYKTCWRDDTDFWKDHKNVVYDYQDHILSILGDYYVDNEDYIMFMHTIAAKDQTWNSNSGVIPFKQPEFPIETMHHMDYIDIMRKQHGVNL
jgi:tryptophan halogenase